MDRTTIEEDNTENGSVQTNSTQSHEPHQSHYDTGGLRRRTRTTSGVFKPGNRKRRSLATARASQVPEDDSLFAVQDDDEFSVFAQGRDYEPVYITHQYTAQEKETLNSYESSDYLPNHSHVFKHWIKRQMISNLETDRWIMMGLIGFTVGLVGFLLHQLIERISYLKWSVTKDLLERELLAEGWLFCVGYTMAFAAFSAMIIVLWRPSAGGSGLPEITGFLNGTQMPKIFSLKTFGAKFLSCVTAIGCGMPIGPEGPMIHLGAIVGAGLSQTTSTLLRFKLPFFERFRNPEDRRNFITAGVAAGVSAAFGAPVGGLLFCMEEVSSFWNNTLSWQIFFCCIMATSTSDLFNSAFKRFESVGTFGAFQTSQYILFNIEQGVDINVLMFIPAAIIGAIGGLLGSLFIILNLKVTRFRKRKLAAIRRPWLVKVIRLLEPALVMQSSSMETIPLTPQTAIVFIGDGAVQFIMSTLAVFLPMAIDCVPYKCVKGGDTHVSDFCVNDTRNEYSAKFDPEATFHTCEEGVFSINGTTTNYNGTYNELAMLIFASKDDVIKRLYLRNAHETLSYGPLFIGLVIYFIMVCWAAGTSVAAGILVPMLVIGGLYGRIIGLAMVDLFGLFLNHSYWVWIDPGAFALIGSASFFSGVARLAPAITVIMMELTNDLKVLLPVMTSVMVAKWVGDFFTHPLFHALLELKCIPFLSQQPSVRIDKRNVKLELFAAQDIMTFPVVTLNLVEKVSVIAETLLTHSHNGYPVVKTTDAGKTVFYGLITRKELLVILENRDILHEGVVEPMNDVDLDIAPIGYEKMLRGPDLKTSLDAERFLAEFLRPDSPYKNHKIDLTPYSNQSAMNLPLKFSLHRAYTLITALGLRHLTITDEDNQVQGIITRKDLMGFNMVEVLSTIMQTRPYFQDYGREGDDRDDDEEEGGGGGGGRGGGEVRRGGEVSSKDSPRSHDSSRSHDSPRSQDSHVEMEAVVT